ncbi:MAG TPA: CHAT domain-containing tetratricopeptide repeat protein, partial [Vicinamibacterales bacterium]|nr:CHAT domain-containing tetratricopeptide repeat protein [Vicinamibacterales bacterium]
MFVRFVRAAAFIVFSSGVLSAQSQTPSADKPIAERTIAGGDVHRYELVLAAGEYVRASVMQRGVDVVVQAIGPSGAVLGRFNEEMRDGMDERVELVASESGTYTLTVSTAFARAAPGIYTIRIADRRTATDDDRSQQAVRVLQAEYSPMLEQYRSAAAQPLVERALSAVEHAFSPDDIHVAVIRRDLARALRQSHQYEQAQPLYERAAAVFELTLGAEHPRTAEVWMSLAAMYGQLGQRPKAEALARRALEVTERALGPDHPQVALGLITLATRLNSVGDQERTEELERRALGIVERTLGEMDPQTAVVLHNLGATLLDKDKFDEADVLLRRSLAIDEKVRPDADLETATTLHNLGIIARERKDYAAAEDYYLRALELRRRTLGPDHADVARNLNNLANVYRAKGDVATSLEMHRQVLSIFERTAGPYSGGTVLSLGNLARTYAGIGDVTHAIEFQRRADAAIETQLTLNLAIGSERQKLAFVNSLADRTARTVSLDAANQFKEPAITELAALVVLQRKGRVLDAMTDTLAPVRQRLGTETAQRLFDDLAATTRELARLALSDPPDLPSTDRPAAIKRLEAQKENLEYALSQQSAEFRPQARSVTLDAVRAAIPDDAALIEFEVYRPFDPNSDTNSTAYGVPHYAAYVITSHQAVRGFDLGRAVSIDESVEALRLALADPARTDVNQLSRRVDALVLQPLRAALGDSHHLLISADGTLNLIPFEALRDDGNRYAIERYAISYLSTGRDLLRMQVPHASRSGPVVIADPSFGNPDEAVGSLRRRSITSVDDLSGAYFARLDGTADEARRIQSLFPGATVLMRERATKSALLALESPRLLHIATHGFFLNDQKIPNPLLRSGLALSGANTHASARDHQTNSDAILTALEASNLNLWGTKLVTLSACDTGVGEIRNGEGVYGLRRAFFLAGAETLVMSLWPVSDSVTREVMSAYYSGLKDGAGRGDALRTAQLAMLARRSR